jgi:uncharacterized membrane protein YfcA
MQEWLILAAAMLATGCVAGILAGLFGIGGGIVIVPVLDTALGLVGVDPAIRMHVAVATSLATIIPTSISSARAHHRRGAVNVEIVRRWAIWMLLGSVAGVFVASRLHSSSLALVFATLALLVAIKMLAFPETRNLTNTVPRSLPVLGLPFSIGGLSSMMGIGGGTFSVVALTLFGESIHRAVGTAALFGLFISLPGTLAFIVAGLGDARIPSGSLGYVNLIGFALIVPASVLAAPLGARLAHAISQRKLTMMFGVFLVLASARLYFRAFA